MRYLAIGDIHGCRGQLEQLLRKLNGYSCHQMVFLGDYIDIGPDSKGVIELLLQVQRDRPDAHFLLGNHEIEMLAYIDTGDFVRYAKRGGLATIRSYCGTVAGDVHASFVESVPPSHISFLRRLELFFETPKLLFAHAGCDPRRPLDRTIESMTLTSHASLLESSGSLEKVVVCGHYFQRSLKPLLQEHLIAVDSGCGVLGGPLSAVAIPSRRVIQA